jgi:aminoglycoside phosphotransferase (APT) family kinase protein
VPTVAELVPLDRLRGWLDSALADAGASASEPVLVEPVGEGHSNLTFRVVRGPRAYVLRRPPAGPLLPTAHDVVREYRVLALLQSGTVRVPRVVALCDDPSVIGASFYLMEDVDGSVVRAELPAWLSADAQHVLGLDLVDALSEIHGVPWQPFVAAGIGRPGGYLARQLRRWTGQRDGIRDAVAAVGGRARELPDYDAVRDWLTANLPDEAEPALVHGDFKLDNVIVGPGEQPRVAAVVDWEMATVGDPRADLGYLLSFWPEPGERFPLGHLVARGTGFPTRAELVDRWTAGTGRDPGDPRWFVTLAIWKLAVLLEASYHRWLAGTATDPFFATLDEGVPALLARAREVCGA